LTRTSPAAASTPLSIPRTRSTSPSTTHGTVAKIVLSIVLGLAALAILSLLWIGTRLGRRNTFGRKSSVAVRSLFPLLVGTGGWCLGALTALSVLPTVPLDDPVLAIVSIGPSIAAVVYACWFGRTAPAGSAAVAALLGAWLGFHVPHTPAMGAVTAILAANLAVIALDTAKPQKASRTIRSRRTQKRSHIPHRRRQSCNRGGPRERPFRALRLPHRGDEIDRDKRAANMFRERGAPALHREPCCARPASRSGALALAERGAHSARAQEGVDRRLDTR
jgi:hypothetical protein